MASPVPNGSYLQQADPQTFPANATGASPSTTYQQTAPQQEQQSTEPTPSKDEIGWYFVEQYYTTLNKTPERVHLFYTKKSTFVWGAEGESLPVSHGRADIQEKIAAHNFKDCKVRVSNVDSQASCNNGIVIQVLGEMSNNGLPNRKFSQTFFLAEQPNGYYVHNDILRFLKDDEEDLEDTNEYEAVEQEEEIIAEVAEAIEQAKEEILEEVQNMTVQETTAVEIETAEETVRVEETVTLEPAAAEPVEETAAVNGTAESTEAPEEVAPEPEAAAEAEPEVAAPVEVAEEKPAEEPTPAPAPAPVEKKAAPPAPVKQAPPPAPAAPPRPTTWASLVATKPVATTATPTSTTPAATAVHTPAAAAPVAHAPAPVTAAPAAPASSSPAANPAGGAAWQAVDSKRHSRANNQNNAAAGGQAAVAYVKNVTDSVTDANLREALSKFGNLKHVEINRPKNCAFVEFENPAALTAAARASPHMIAGSSILVEEKRKPAAGPFRGGMARGDGRPQGQGRGGFSPRNDGQRFDGGRGGRGGRGGFGGARGGAKAPAAGN
ncbi:hypothetical protein BZA77DRAFT_85882 [Pyronema omphalodes]|nr:hypothetical protein BZA77DRAFT_85882 [Pyronema omphalodes]